MDAEGPCLPFQGAERSEADGAAGYTVKNVMSEGPVVWVNDTATCVEAARLMLENNVGLLPVKNSADLLVGVVTDRDLIVRVVAKALHADGTAVATVMSAQHSVALVYADANLVAAERLMVDRGVRRLPVTRRSDNQVVGIISVDDFAAAGFRRRAGEILRASVRGVAPVRGLQVPSALGAPTQPAVNAPYVTPSVYTVNDVMTGLPEMVRERDTCRDAASKMEARSVGFLVVYSDAQPARIRGVITDRDIVTRVLARGLAPEAVKVSDVLSGNVAACTAEENLANAERLMLARNVRRLPVLRAQSGELLGVLSVDDLAMAASRSRAGRVLENVALSEAMGDHWGATRTPAGIA